MGFLDSIFGGQDDDINARLAEATKQYDELDTPDVAAMQQRLDGLVQQGVITPEQAQTVLLEQSKLNGITLDPHLKQAQMDALAGLQDVSSSGGMTATDQANLSKIATDEATKQRGSREAILQNAQARGLGGSGIELLSQMQNQQDSATRQNARDLDVAGQAKDRALAALMQAGTLGGQIQNQDFNQQAQVATADDAINKFNAANQMQVNQTNVAANNQAQAANLAEKQRLNDTKIQAKNQLDQQAFNNSYQKAAGKANALAGQASGLQQQAAGSDALFGQLTGSLLGAGATVATGGAAAKKKDVG